MVNDNEIARTEPLDFSSIMHVWILTEREEHRLREALVMLLDRRRAAQMEGAIMPKDELEMVFNLLRRFETVTGL